MVLSAERPLCWHDSFCARVSCSWLKTKSWLFQKQSHEALGAPLTPPSFFTLCVWFLRVLGHNQIINSWHLLAVACSMTSKALHFSPKTILKVPFLKVVAVLHIFRLWRGNKEKQRLLPCVFHCNVFEPNQPRMFSLKWLVQANLNGTFLQTNPWSSFSESCCSTACFLSDFGEGSNKNRFWSI